MLTKTIGDISVTRVQESLGPGFFPEFLFPDWDPQVLSENKTWLEPYYFDSASGKFMSSIHTWVVRTKDHVILIDTCTGNHKQRPAFERFNMLNTDFLARLKLAGVDPLEVDYVLCTHLHVDHVGWNTQLEDGRWVPTFPNARYVFSKIEHDRWNPLLNQDSNTGINQNVYNDSVLPIVEAGMADMTTGNFAIGDCLTIEAAPGHTLGHTVIKAQSQGSHALFSGDVMHHPLQVLNPHWNSRFCELPEVARSTRRRVLEHCCESNALLMPAHFGYPHACKVSDSHGKFKLNFDFSE